MTSDSNGSSKRRAGRGWTALGCALVLLVQLALVADTGAAEEAAGLSELKAAAYDAQEAAARAREAAERAQAAVKAAQHSQAEVPAVAPAQAPEAVAAPAAGAGAAVSESAAAAPAEPVPAADDAARARELERATAEARAAGDAARRVLRELEEQKRQYEMRYARRGLYLGGGAFYAPQYFDDFLYYFDGSDYYPLHIKSSRGLYGQLGYRVHPHIALELRYDWIEGFEVSRYGAVGEVDGWTVTGNLQLFLLTRSFQPYVGFGLGAIEHRVSVREEDGPDRLDETSTDTAMRVGGGIDYYLSERVAVSADAAYVASSGEHGLHHATLSAGIKLRF